MNEFAEWMWKYKYSDEVFAHLVMKTCDEGDNFRLFSVSAYEE